MTPDPTLPDPIAQARAALAEHDGQRCGAVGARKMRWLCNAKLGHVGRHVQSVPTIPDGPRHLRAALSALDAETKRADTADAEVARLRCDLARVSMMSALNLRYTPDTLIEITEVRPPRSGEKLR